MVDKLALGQDFVQLRTSVFHYHHIPTNVPCSSIHQPPALLNHCNWQRC